MVGPKCQKEETSIKSRDCRQKEIFVKQQNITWPAGGIEFIFTLIRLRPLAFLPPWCCRTVQSHVEYEHRRGSQS